MKKNIFVALILIGILLYFSGIFLTKIKEEDKTRTYNIKIDFHARGDGIHDDTRIIQEAIDSVPEGSKLIFPKGNYKISNKLKHKIETGYGVSYSSIKISKPIKIIFKENAIINIETGKNCGLFWIYKTRNVTIKGGRLLGNKMPTQGLYTSHVGILIQNSSNCKLDGVYLRNYTQGINLYYSNKINVQNITVENNMASGIISFGSRNCLINNCFVRDSSDGHLSLYGGGKNNIVKNCFIIEDRINRNTEQGLTVEGEKNSIIDNNKITGFYYGIDIKNGSENITVKRNRSFNNRFNIAIRPGDSRLHQRISNKIMLIGNNVLDQKSNISNAQILISVGNNHMVSENIINSNKLIIGSNVVNKNKNYYTTQVKNNNFYSEN